MDEETEKDSKAKRQPTGDYGGGYCRPQEATQFKKGRSGNRRGRPKGTKNIATHLIEILQERISVREGGRVRTMSKAEAMLQKMAHKAMMGDSKALSSIIAMARMSGLFDQVTKDNGGATGVLLVGIPQGHTLESFEKECRKHQLELQAEAKIVNRPSDE